MSYSFQLQAASKAEAKARVAHELAKVAAQQPAHAQDMGPAVTAAHAFIDLLHDDPEKDVMVSMHGSVGYEWHATSNANAPHQQLNNAAVSVSAYHTARANAA
jgi:hypothetical protein